MIRRIAALIGIAFLLATLVLLIWTVHHHRERTMRGTGGGLATEAGPAGSSKGELL